MQPLFFVMSIISIKNLYVDLNDEEVLNNVSLEINEGEYICIVGKNGSGKTTFVKTLNGIILPTKGDVNVLNMNTKDESKIIEIRKNVGMVFQNPDNQMVASLVEEDVAFGLENIGIETKEMHDRVNYALKKVKIEHLRDQNINKLSGGQKQKVCIAGILAMKPKIMIFDEPTSMLDPYARNEILEEIYRLNKEENITIIHITHFMSEIEKADRVLLLNEGKLIKDTYDIDNFLNNIEDIKKYNLELPLKKRIELKLKECH